MTSRTVSLGTFIPGLTVQDRDAGLPELQNLVGFNPQFVK